MRWGQRYFAVQALGGAAWWAAVFSMPAVRDATLGGLDPVVVAIFDIPLFVLASAIAAFGVRSAAVLAAAWTALVTLALAGYATLSTEAGWGVLAMVAASVGSTLAACLIVRGRIPTDWIIRGPFAFRPAAIRSPVISHMAATLGQIVVFWGFFLLVLPLLIGGLENRWQLTLPFAGFLAPASTTMPAAASALGISAAAHRCPRRCPTGWSSPGRTDGCATRWRWPESCRAPRSGSSCRPGSWSGTRSRAL
jgi:hypothetical protein